LLYGLLQLLYLGLLVLDGSVSFFNSATCISSINGQSLFQILEDVPIVYDEAIYLLAKDTIGPGYGLHEGVVSHGFIQVDCGAGRSIEARYPHGADKDKPERISGVLELLVQVLLNHALSVRQDVQAFFVELIDLVLGLGDDHGHIRLSHELDSLFQLLLPGSACLTGLGV